MSESVDPKIIVALDYACAEPALSLARRLDPARCRLKVGKELFTSAGPELVRRLAGEGFGVFLDLKFHDIPNTVAGACRAAARLGVWMLNVHALGGSTMLRAAAEAVAASEHRPLLIAVTVLTSMDDGDLAALGLGGTVDANVSRLAALAEAAGLDGVVCSPREAPRLRAELREAEIERTRLRSERDHLLRQGRRVAADQGHDGGRARPRRQLPGHRPARHRRSGSHACAGRHRGGDRRRALSSCLRGA